MESKNVQIVGQPYVYENVFKNQQGEMIEYAQLAVDVKIGDTVKRLSRKLVGFEKEYIKTLISSDNAFNEGD